MPTPAFRFLSPVPSPILGRIPCFSSSTGTSSDSRSDCSLGCTRLISPVQLGPQPSPDFIGPSPPGISTVRFVHPRRVTSTLRPVHPRPGTATARLVPASSGTTTVRFVPPSQGTATVRLLSSSPGTASPRLIQQCTPVSSRQHLLALTPVTEATRYALMRPPLSRRRIDLSSASLRLSSPGAERAPGPRLASFRPVQTGPASARICQPVMASFRPPQPGQQAGGLNEPGAYDDHDGAGCSFWKNN
jgi:hypothetical protein